MVGMRNELTRFLDGEVKPEHKAGGKFCYIFVDCYRNPMSLPLGDSHSTWYVDVNGYCVADVVVSNENPSVICDIKLNKMSGFELESERSVFVDHERVQREAREKFVGKELGDFTIERIP